MLMKMFKLFKNFYRILMSFNGFHSIYKKKSKDLKETHGILRNLNSL